MKGHKTLYCLLTLIMGLGETAAAFNPPRDVVGPLSVEITAPDKVADLDKPVDATISLANSGTTPLEVRLEIWGVDEWRFGAQKAQRIERTLRLAAGAKEQVALSLTAGLETHNAHYPIHARGTFTDPASGEKRQAHAIKIFLVEASRSTAPAGPVAIKAGVTSLVRFRHQSVALWSSETGTTRALGAGWRGTDDRTGAVFNVAAADRGGRLESLSVHPPWRKKWGTIWADYDLILPITKPITLTFSTAIRDTGPDEPPGDGVEFKVIVIERKDTGEPATSSAESAAGAPTLLFTRLAKSKKWEPASVDLSAYAGKPITLRFWNGPGPANNTICDSGYWGNPAISVGAAMPPTVREPKQVMTGIGKAWDYGTEAWGGKVGDWTWQLKSKAGAFGASLYPSSEGIPDIVVALAQDKEALIFDGFTVQVDNVDLKTIPLSPKTQWRSAFANGRGVIEGDLLHNGQSLTVRMEVWAESGALRFRFSMPRVKRDKRGHPRFTLIGLGRTAFARKDPPPSRAISALVGQAKRVYAGFGNVIEEPKRFDLSANGFRLSTRHVGVDYGNGLSLVQASDVFPDRFHIDPEQHTYSLQVHHDATISLIPSEKGAFAAAEVYRDGIAGFRPAAGVARLLGRMCLDYWGMSYEHGIATVETLAKYGVTDCVYVWHNWQRWGYDYRLPEIYPARGDHAQFVRLAGTCRKRGILFCPHDNYIDFYPDADGFSYDHIIFNEDGTPQRAWFNKGRNAQSYRWLPHAFQPWLKKNIALLKRDVKPTAYFIDVFTAIEPMDYYDRSGRFYPKTETIRRWSECWDYVRRQLRGAPMISEAGSDSQIGHLDAGESDHNAAAPQGSPQWGWNVQCADAERTPWHDMASHGSFILFAGGLASRYVSGLDVKTHGYGSDDYLSLTVLGGRNPMAHGDGSAETILTYWLLHDVCAELGRRPMTGHEFAGNIHRQTVRFGDDAVVRVNRDAGDWGIGDTILPQYGFVARIRTKDRHTDSPSEVRAEVVRRNGIVCGYAESAKAIFADARPSRPSLANANAERAVVDFGPVATNGAFRLLREQNSWKIIMLPGCPVSEIRLRPARLAGRSGVQVERMEKISDTGTIIGPVEFTRAGDEIVFNTSADDFGYRVLLR